MEEQVFYQTSQLFLQVFHVGLYPLSLEEVQAFAEPYGLAIIELIPIKAVFKTQLFLVDQSQKQYVLTVFEELDAEGR